MLQTAYLPLIIDGCFGYNGKKISPKASLLIFHMCTNDHPFSSLCAIETTMRISLLEYSSVIIILDEDYAYSYKAMSITGNWELSMAEAIAAISVFCDDTASFAQALKLWRGRVPGYFYLTTDGKVCIEFVRM